MANTVVMAPARPPGRVWYFVAFLIFIVGLVAMVALMIGQFGDIGSRMIRVIVPGQSELMLEKTGNYTIFHEYRSIVDNRVFAVEAISDLIVTVRSKATGENLPLQTNVGSNYALEGRAGRSILNFTIAEPGSYLLITRYGDGRREPQTVLTIDRGFVGSLLLTIGGALSLLFGGLAGAVGLAILVAVKRRRAKQGSLP